MKKIDNTIKIWGLPLVSTTKSQVLSEVSHWIDNSSKVAYIFTPNPEQVVQAWQLPSFQTTLLTARWLLPDGMGLIWASQLFSLINGQPALTATLPGRAVVADLIHQAKLSHWQIVLIGGRGYTQRFPADWPVVWVEGYVDAHHPTREEEATVVTLLKKYKPSIVMVAFGAPLQECWLVEHQALLNQSQVKIGMAVGGSFDTLLGILKPAPRVISQLGLEWLFRLIQQPWRWRRQARLLVFLWLTMVEMFQTTRRLAADARAN